MLFRAILQEFIRTSPASVYVRAVLERVFAPAKLDRIFAMHARRP